MTCPPAPSVVTRATGVLADRASFNRSNSVAVRSSALQPLDPHFDLSTSGQADVPVLLVTDAEVQQPRLPAGHDVERLLDDRTLDAAARDRTDHSPVAVHDQPRTDRARRTAPEIGRAHV